MLFWVFQNVIGVDMCRFKTSEGHDLLTPPRHEDSITRVKAFYHSERTLVWSGK